MNKSNMHTPILDSMLITPTNIHKDNKLYNIKIVDCGGYSQVYVYENRKLKKIKNEDLKLVNNICNIQENNKDTKLKEVSEIEERNIIRSKLECQRIAKSNMQDWETFITLTFEENIIDIENANKRFRYFIDKIRRIKKDFKYLCIPEFQKRGAVHYHLLSNIKYDDVALMYTQEDNTKYKHIKYWNDGFTSVEPLKGDAKKVVGYISKYMTKDIDNRLFGHRRYFYSNNIVKPTSKFLDISNENELELYKKIIQGKELIYHNEYLNPYDNTKVSFLEFL